MSVVRIVGVRTPMCIPCYLPDYCRLYTEGLEDAVCLADDPLTNDDVAAIIEKFSAVRRTTL